jgi:hypothetical protein
MNKANVTEIKRFRQELQELNYSGKKFNRVLKRSQANFNNNGNPKNQELRNYLESLATGTAYNNTKAKDLLKRFPRSQKASQLKDLSQAANRTAAKAAANAKKAVNAKAANAKAAANAEKAAENATLLQEMGNLNKVTNNKTLASAKELYRKYRNRYRFQPGFQNHAQAKALVTKIEKYEATKKAAISKASKEQAAANKASKEKAAANKAAANKEKITQLLSQTPFNIRAAENFLKSRSFLNRSNNVQALRAKLSAQKAIPEYNEAAVRQALSNYLTAAVKPRYNKALVNAMLRLPELNDATKQNLVRSQQSRGRRLAGALGRGAVVAGGALGRGAVVAGGALGRLRGAPSFIPGANGSRIPVGYVFKTGQKGLGYYRNNKALQSQIETLSYGPAFGGALGRLRGAPRFIPGANGSRIPVGYVFKTGPNGLGYYRNNKALQSQIETLSYGPPPRIRGTGTGTGTGPNRGTGTGTGTGGGGIIFRPTITVGAARIGAQTFGGTRVGGQQMGSQRTSTGNVAGARTGGIEVGGPRAATGNVAGARTGNAGGARTNGNVGVTSEQLIRAGGGSEAIEKGIVALRQTGGNAAKASAISRLPMNTFTNIYAMGGPVAAKKAVESRRRVTKKKRVARKPRKQYIKLTPYQFKRLTDHIKKNNLRKVLIKEITH